MNEQNVIFFTHIPKTAGTSFKYSMVYPNFQSKEICEPQGRLQFLLENKQKVRIVQGHLRFGIHRFSTKQPTYICFLRDPIQRAISHYYFIKQSKYPTYTHPEHQLVNSLPINEYFKLKGKDNLQTRFIAGYGMFGHGYNSQKLLNKAIKNLTNYYKLFGIKERYEESLFLFRRYFGWTLHTLELNHKYTKIKPQKEEINKSVLTSLQETHQLDMQLYDFAIEEFEHLLSCCRGRQ